MDARWMTGRLRGMGRYAHSLLAPVRHRLAALLPEGMQLPDYRNIVGGKSFFPYWEQIELPRLCAEHGVTRLVCPYNTAPLFLPRDVKLTLVVHDLIYLEPWSELPPSIALYQTVGRIYRRHVVPRVVRNADRLITVSEFSKAQLIARFDIPAGRITVIPNSVSEDWRVATPLDDSEREPYVLAVAGEAPSKNVPCLLRAFARFRNSRQGLRPQLRIVGISSSHLPAFRRRAERLGLADSVHFLDGISDEELQMLYRRAWVFVLPSLYEGFGIPLLEAMASGTPIACSRVTSMPEVVGDAALQFDPRDEADMAARLDELWSSSELRARYIQRGLSRVERFRREIVGAQIDSYWRTHP